FVLWPVRTSGGQKPIAIFTDGFLYHKDKVADDTLKREAIRQSSRFRVWSLSWKDVQNVFQTQGDYATLTLFPEKMPSGNRIYRPTIVNGHVETLHPDKLGTFELLAKYLENPDAEKIFAVHAQAYALSLLDPKNVNNSVVFADWKYLIEPISEMLSMRDVNFELTDTLFGKWVPGSSNSHLTILAGVSSEDMKRNKSRATVTVCALLNDEKEKRTDKYEAEWNGFWQFFNMMQFLQSFAAVSQNGLNQYIYYTLSTMAEKEAASAVQYNSSDEAWTEIMELVFDDEAKECIRKLMLLGVIAPSVVGYELADSTGEIIAECELAWEKEKIALLLISQMDSKESFLENGWTVFTTEDTFSAEMFQGGMER
ncbi:MAG: helicase, partial [Desulfitobacteriaceae bacterium]|nr:helicase [Desulfitobacteriaceae bacterium]